MKRKVRAKPQMHWRRVVLINHIGQGVSMCTKTRRSYCIFLKDYQVSVSRISNGPTRAVMAGRLKKKANVEIAMLMRMTRTLLGHRVFTNLIFNDERINLAVSHIRQMLRKCRDLDRVRFIDAQTTCACKLPVLRTELDELLNTNDFEIEHPRFGLKALPHPQPTCASQKEPFQDRLLTEEVHYLWSVLCLIRTIYGASYIQNGGAATPMC